MAVGTRGDAWPWGMTHSEPDKQASPVELLRRFLCTPAAPGSHRCTPATEPRGGSSHTWGLKPLPVSPQRCVEVHWGLWWELGMGGLSLSWG